MEQALKTRMPRYLDAPAKILLWTLDEVAVFLVPFLLLTFVFHHGLLGLFMGPLALMGLKKLKGEQGIAYLWSLAYWHLPPVVRFKALPPSAQRLYRG